MPVYTYLSSILRVYYMSYTHIYCKHSYACACMYIYIYIHAPDRTKPDQCSTRTQSGHSLKRCVSLHVLVQERGAVSTTMTNSAIHFLHRRLGSVRVYRYCEGLSSLVSSQPK